MRYVFDPDLPPGWIGYFPAPEDLPFVVLPASMADRPVNEQEVSCPASRILTPRSFT